jgi:hypothetical protein
MKLCFYRADQYSSYAHAVQQHGVRTITGLQTEHRRLFNVVGDLSNTFEAIFVTACMMDSKATLRFVLFDDDGIFLDAC